MLIVEKIALSTIGKISSALFDKFYTSFISYSHKKTPQTNTLECYKFYSKYAIQLNSSVDHTNAKLNDSTYNGLDERSLGLISNTVFSCRACATASAAAN